MKKFVFKLLPSTPSSPQIERFISFLNKNEIKIVREEHFNKFIIDERDVNLILLVYGDKFKKGNVYIYGKNLHITFFQIAAL